MKEDQFVSTVFNIAKSILKPPYFIKRASSLFYQITLDNKLDITIDPKYPKRGQSAFQTDLCIFEQIDSTIKIPRVVFEFKKSLSTHDVILYSSKASRHKEIYPYLRYGLVVGNESKVPGKFFTHNRALDFCIAAKNYNTSELKLIFTDLFNEEIQVSKHLEKIIFDKVELRIFRNSIHNTIK